MLVKLEFRLTRSLKFIARELKRSEVSLKG